MSSTLIVVGAILLLVIFFISKGLTIVQQSETVIIERLGRYHKTLSSGVNIIMPFIDKARPMTWRYTLQSSKGTPVVRFSSITHIDLRETVYDFARQSVITRDNVVTEINAILYFQIVDPMRAMYEISNLPVAIEMLTQTSLRNVIGEMDLDATLTSRDTINNKLRIILDEATNKWGVKVNRVELQDIDPPREIRDAMEKQMRAERDRRAAILTAEGKKQSDILTAEGESRAAILRAEGEKQAQILRAEGDAQSTVLRADGEADAVRKVFEAIHQSNPSQQLLTYQYLQTLPKLADGQANKLWFIPTELGDALRGLGNAFGTLPVSDLKDAPVNITKPKHAGDDLNGGSGF